MTNIQSTQTLYLIRHGETDWNEQKRLQGRKDIALNSTGRRQAVEAGLCLKWLLPDPSSVDFIASPLLRTRETMDIIRKNMSLPADDCRHDERLLEISFGEWEGLTWDEVQTHQPGLFQARQADALSFTMPGGESYPEVFERVNSLLATLTRDTVLVAHAGVLRSIMALQAGVNAQLIPHIDIPQGKVLLVRDGGFIWLQAKDTVDGQ